MSGKRSKPKYLVVNVNMPGELRVWAKYFGCTQQNIRDAVKSSGVAAEDVWDWVKLNVVR